MLSWGGKEQLYAYIHKFFTKKLRYFQNKRAPEHVSATLNSLLRGYFKTHTSLGIALQADRYRLIAEKCRSAFVFKNYCNLMVMNVFLCIGRWTILSLPLNITGDGTLPVATFVLAVVTFGVLAPEENIT